VLLLQGHRDSVRCVAFAPTAARLATGFSPDGQTAVAAGRSPDVVLWDVG
jgi:WD domain, G-beta repeat